MGVFFSRPGRDQLPPGAALAGNLSVVDNPAVAPYLGINTGSYESIPTTQLPPIPLEWIVSPRELPFSCSDGSQFLTWFGVTEAVICVLLLLAAYRPFLHWMSRGYLGRRTKRSITLAWMVAFGCQLLASAINAVIVGKTPGYGQLNMLHIFTVYMARPRYYFLVLGILRCLVAVQRTRDFDKTSIVNRKIDDRVEFPFTDAWISVSISEMLLLIITALFTGVTWHRMPGNSIGRDFASDHVNFICSAPALLFLGMLAFVPVYKRYGEAYPLEGRRYETGRHWGVTTSRTGQTTIGIKKTTRQSMAKRLAGAAVGAIVVGYVPLVQWAYWTRFFQISGPLFCPPKQIATSMVWGIFTLIGLMAGAAC